MGLAELRLPAAGDAVGWPGGAPQVGALAVGAYVNVARVGVHAAPLSAPGVVCRHETSRGREREGGREEGHGRQGNISTPAAAAAKLQPASTSTSQCIRYCIASGT